MNHRELAHPLAKSIEVEQKIDTLEQRDHVLWVEQESTPSLDPGKVAEHLLQQATELIDAEAASVWLLEVESSRRLVCRAASPHDQTPSPVGLSLDLGQGIASWVIQNEGSAIAPRVREDQRFFPGIDAQTGFRTNSLLAVPLRTHGVVIGVLEVVNKRHGDFDEDDRTLAEALAASAAIAIENAQLVEALRQRALELESRNIELDAFAHNVAHELKNPLSLVAGYAGVVERELATLPTDDVLKYIRVIGRNAWRMDQIISNMLLFAQVRQEDVEIVLLDMTSIVAEALEHLEELIDVSRAEITLPEAWPGAMGHGPWVEGVWVNYLSNAIKYGGRPPRVELGASMLPDGMALFWTRDNGPGLAAEERLRLFTPFTRLHQGSLSGHGLGLAIVKRIVSRLGGEVSVESERGRGSKFSFTLPGARGEYF